MTATYVAWRVFSCNLPPALWAEWVGAFTCYCSNTGVERVPKWESAQSIDAGEKIILHPLLRGFKPATFQSRMRHSNYWAIPASRGGWERSSPKRFRRRRGAQELRGLYTCLHCHHQNDFCIQIGSDQRAIFDVLFIVRARSWSQKAASRNEQLPKTSGRKQSQSGEWNRTSPAFQTKRLTARPNRRTHTHTHTNHRV